MSPYRILSMDGGGIRGVLTAALLERLDAAHPGFLGQIDLFAGTSTGGILALGFARGFTPAEARQLYERLGDEVFADTVLDDLRDLGMLIGADYSLVPLRTVLAGLFGEKRLVDLQKRVLITTFDLDNATGPNSPDPPPPVRSWKPKFFHNFPGDDSDGDQKMVDVAVRTSAAPTYFPIYQGYIDGGVVAANPAMCALAQALHPTTGGQQLSEIILLSLGTGLSPAWIDSQNGDWGLAQWAPKLVGLMLEGGGRVVEYQCRQVLDDRFFRIDPILPEKIDMDEVSKIPRLKEVAAACDLSEAIAWVSRHFD